LSTATKRRPVWVERRRRALVDDPIERGPALGVAVADRQDRIV
jgi:hypothetical protein